MIHDGVDESHPQISVSTSSPDVPEDDSHHYIAINNHRFPVADCEKCHPDANPEEIICSFSYCVSF